MKKLVYQFYVVKKFLFITLYYKYRLYYMIDQDWFFYYSKSPFSLRWHKHHTKNGLMDSFNILLNIKNRYKIWNYNILHEINKYNLFDKKVNKKEKVKSIFLESP